VHPPRHPVGHAAPAWPDIFRRVPSGSCAYARATALSLAVEGLALQTDPLGPENKLIFVSGPLVGTGAVTGASCNIITKSSLTNTLACAKMRGHFGAELKFAGFDMVIIEGRAEAPVIVSIADDKIKLVPALEYWGRSTVETEDLFKKNIGDQWSSRETFLAAIGPAGERLLPLANIVNDRFLSVGGGGIGAVMGSKNLKALAVKGQHSLQVADGKRFVQVINTLINKLNSAPLTSQSLSKWGTAFLVGLCSQKGILPQLNFRGNTLSLKNIGTDALNSAFVIRSRSCFSCPVGCIKKTDVRHPAYEGRGMVPTYLAIGSLGVNCGINDLEVIGMANMLCAEMGLDPVTTGGTLATAMDLVEQKSLTPEELKVDLSFGNGKAMLEAIRLMSTKNGHARRLGQGGRALAESFERPDLFMGVKGMSLAPFDPRAIQGLGLHFATCNYGPHHLFGNTFIDELLNVHEKIDPWEVEGKPQLVKNYQDTTAVMDSLGLCSWPLMGLKFKNYVPMTNSCLGTSYSADDLLAIGERIWNKERLFNIGAGLGAAQDTLPDRMTREPIADGPAEGQVSRVPEMRPEYYSLRGWNDGGEPLPETLKRLGLEK
ncbi:MAG: aldehyde ferredoxin oxidoreductase family protein, partial [Deltaproteobacteria bacterium]|jgi:aldehyde:ferredoxin oxidoreductase|nr:aldehyde ferredoxin oxidoreductase family protein [Deltaproteobacteria bacterium]